MSIESITQEVVEELCRAEAKFGPFNSSHEGYAVILEELDELWDVVKENPRKIPVPGVITEGLTQGITECTDTAESIHLLQKKIKEVSIAWQDSDRNGRMRAEAIQVAAMAIRFVHCICDKDII